MAAINKRLVLLVLILAVVTGKAQGVVDARSLGMAGSNLAITEGAESINGNPATLARKSNFSFELHLFSLHLMAANNSFSLKDYDRYLTTGDSLTRQDISDILAKIPDSGLRTDAIFGAKTFGFYTRPFALSVTGMGGGFGVIPKAAAEIPFNGNKNVESYSFDDLDGLGWAAASLNLGLGIPLTKYVKDRFDFFSVGVAFRYIVGLQYAEVMNASGNLVTEDAYILSRGHLEVLRSNGGSGLGMDFGAMAQYRDKWTFSLHFTNLVGSINWNRDNEMMVTDFQSDSLRINNIDSLHLNDSDTTYDAGSFRTGLPRAMSLAMAYRLTKKLQLTATWRQGLNKSLGNYTKPLVAVGAEFKPIGILPLRGGIAFGGSNGVAVGLGTGIDLKYWQFNIGYLNHNFRWFRSARSLEIAVSTQFRF